METFFSTAIQRMTTALPRPSGPLQRAAIGSLVAVVLGCTPTASEPLTSTFNGVCLHPGCTPDPGWALQDCDAAEAGLEFFNPSGVTVGANFEAMDGNTGAFVAQYMYGYTDATANTSADRGYQPAATAADRCLGRTGNHVFHLYGGPFLGWGGGIGVAMEHFTQDANLCAGSTAPEYCVPPSAGDAVSVAAMDLSAWEGVAVWARRAPDSQPLLRVLVGTKDTDDDIAFLMYQDPTERDHLYCQRVKECGCLFQDAPCTFYPDGDPASFSTPGYYCGAPGATPSYANMAPAANSTGYSNKCNTTRCDDPYPAYAMAPDLQFAGRPCTAYTTRNGVLSSYCYDPATDPPPASGDQQCGDHFTFPLHLTTEWQLYLVPFATMYQQGWAKRAPYFDLHTVSVLRLTWDSGYIDYWIDDLRFYRHKKAS